MRPRLEDANNAEQKLREQISKLTEECSSLPKTVSDLDKIRDVIGKGGAMIRSICEESGAEIDIQDDGQVRIYGENQVAAEKALSMVEGITAEAEIGKLYTGKVNKIVDFGAFVNILPGTDGLVHISQIAEERVNSVGDYLQEGQEVTVKVLDVDNRGRIKLSIKEALAEQGENTSAE
ncbi:MAG: hypothetical protein CMK79_13465 [Pseudomonadales bacterium]|nr:hypothetical protein [Pseudomonadales bacterium]